VSAAGQCATVELVPSHAMGPLATQLACGGDQAQCEPTAAHLVVSAQLCAFSYIRVNMGQVHVD
jgi:hypothetical protein